tara:strand:+ start:1080 stop:1544 length:465 start_codon:yes stop_codon:yes gene_type:complete
MQVKVADSEFCEISQRPITAFFHNLDEEVHFEDCCVLDYVLSLRRYDSMISIDPFVAALWKIVFQNFSGDVTKESLEKCSEAHRSFVGRIDLTLRCMIENTKFVWRFPEMGLHPRNEVNIADLLILLSDKKQLAVFYKNFCNKKSGTTDEKKTD